MTIEQPLMMVASLLVAFGSQVYLVKRLVAFAKELTGWGGSAVRALSFVIGALIGGLILWPWIETNPGLPVSFYVFIGVLFLLTAGLTASGDYDLNVERREGLGRTPEK